MADETIGGIVGKKVDAAVNVVAPAVDKVQEAYNKNVAPKVEKVQKAAQEAVEAVAPKIENAKDAIDSAKEGAKENTTSALSKVSDFIEPVAGPVRRGIGSMVDKGKELLGVSPDTGSGVKKNSGLIVGALVAVFAMFGMESGAMGFLFAAVALLGGALVDKENGIFAGVLGLKKEGVSIPSVALNKGTAPVQEQERESGRNLDNGNLPSPRTPDTSKSQQNVR
ncbi:MAG: hypothetical protein ABL857_07740 [Rickettsiales bacterium]|jgi:ElaB/YqjD/DUF883 family membrane-anchored ribosome-binding protein